MDATKLFNLADTSVEGGGGGASLLDTLQNLVGLAGTAYVNREFDLTGNAAARDQATAELQANTQAEIAKAQISSQSLIIVAVAIIGAVVLYKVL